MACEDMKALARKLMDDFHQKQELERRRGKARELASVESDLAEDNALFIEHRLTCPVCKNAYGPILVPSTNPVRSIHVHN